MLRLVLLLLYLMASSSSPAPQPKQGGSLDPLGLNSAPPHTEGGGGGRSRGTLPATTSDGD